MYGFEKVKIYIEKYLFPIVFLVICIILLWSLRVLLLSLHERRSSRNLHPLSRRMIIPNVLKRKNISLPQDLPFAKYETYIGGIWSFERELFVCNIAKNSNTKLK